MSFGNPSSIDQPNSTPSPASQEQAWSVQSVLSTLTPPVSSTETPSSPLPFLHILERLKTTKREGWRRFDVPGGESIADHMYRMSILTLLAPPSLRSKLDIPRCTSMALVHDMAEAIVGDITPMDEVSKPEKSRRESTTMDFLTSKLLSPSAGVGSIAGSELKDLWREYEDGETLESRFVHDIDKIELVLQMMEYERRGEGKVDLSEFLGVTKNIRLEECKVWCDQVFDEREEFWKSVGKPLPKDWRPIYDK